MHPKKIIPLVLALSQPSYGSLTVRRNATTECAPESFAYPADQLFGTSLISITASPVYNYTAFSFTPATGGYGTYTVEEFCNVTVTYTHPGWNDTIHATVSLPSQNSWNGRFQGLGGGGYNAGYGSLYTTQALAGGYVAVDSDAGHTEDVSAAEVPSSWALTSPGNVNLYLLEDYASRSLHEMTVIGKAATEAFYGVQPQYSYFTGCSGGGRQALMVAEKYAGDYDGVIAAAPAINIENFVPAGYWAGHIMDTLGVYPPTCEFEAFTQAAIDACDGLDGLKDGIISSPGLCTFDPTTIVGQTFDCNGTAAQFTSDGATIIQAAWTGPSSDDGNIGWFGLNKDAAVASYYTATTCTSNQTCTAAPVGLFSSWILYFLAKNPDYTITNMTDAEFFSYLKQSQNEYHSLLSAASPDLSEFRAAGGKLITWQGLADEAIPTNGTVAYYQQVLELDPDAQSFIRLFHAPGVGHCTGGAGPLPLDALEQLVSWVEEDIAPDTLTAEFTNGTTRNLCAWPLEQTYIGGNASDPDSFNCTLTTIPSIAAEFPFYNATY